MITITADIFLGYVAASNREWRIFGWWAETNAGLSPAKHVTRHDGAMMIRLPRPGRCTSGGCTGWDNRRIARPDRAIGAIS